MTVTLMQLETLCKILGLDAIIDGDNMVANLFCSVSKEYMGIVLLC